MERRITGFALTAAPLAMAAALMLAAWSVREPQWWTAAVHLAILGGVTIMIYGVNLYALPVHSGKPWRSDGLLALQIGAGVIGAWLAAIGFGTRSEWLVRAGHLLAWIGATMFLVNLMLLFRGPGERPPRIPKHERTRQQQIDRAAIPFTMTAGMMVVVGTSLALLLDFWTPERGRWDLVWAHVMLLGFMFPMASGTSYHVLGRWAGRDFRTLGGVKVHLVLWAVGFVAMVLGLAMDWTLVFGIGAGLVAVAMAVWIVMLSQVIGGLVPVTRYGIALAALFLMLGVGLGVMFAFDPATGPRLRAMHVVINLFGFAGLLISGFAWSYVPRIARTRAMAMRSWGGIQLALTAIGCAGGAMLMGLRMYGHVAASTVIWPAMIGAGGLLLLAIAIGATFASGPEEGAPD